MAMEPLGSVMTLQAQTVRPVESAKPAPQPSMDATAQEVGAQLDATTLGVSQTQGKGDSADSNSSNNAYAGQSQASKEQIKDAVEKINKNMDNAEAVFGIHDKTNRITIKIVDKETKKVIKELPPEKTLDMIAKVWEMAGILVDERR